MGLVGIPFGMGVRVVGVWAVGGGRRRQKRETAKRESGGRGRSNWDGGVPVAGGLCSCGVSRGFGRGVGLVCMCGCVGGVGCYSPGVCASSWELRIDVSKSLVARGGDGSTRGRLAAVGRDFRVPVWTTFDCGASRRRGCGRCVLWRGWEREWRDGGRVQKARHETNLIKPISHMPALFSPEGLSPQKNI